MKFNWNLLSSFADETCGQSDRHDQVLLCVVANKNRKTANWWRSEFLHIQWVPSRRAQYFTTSFLNASLPLAALSEFCTLFSNGYITGSSWLHFKYHPRLLLQLLTGVVEEHALWWYLAELWVIQRCCFSHIGYIQPNVNMKMPVFWVVAPRSLVEFYRRFRGACYLYYQGDEQSWW
jgi:hypothetical protein